MPNFGMLIKGHNKRILEEHMKKEHENEEKVKQKEKKPTRGRPKTIVKKDCTCQRNHPCPLEGKCNLKNVIYQTIVNLDNVPDRFYIGQAKDFKLRYNNHQQSFRNKNLDENCNLKDEIWELKESGRSFKLKWKILRHCKAYMTGDKSCCLCLDEKLTIQDHLEDPENINKDPMVQTPCLHKYFYKIANAKDDT